MRRHSAQPTPRGTAALHLLAACVLLSLCAVGLALSARSIARQWNTRHWVETPATVTRSTPFSQSGVWRSRAIAYRYDFAGTTVENDRYCMGMGWLSRKVGERDRASLAVGHHTSVFVNPNRPQESVIRAGLMGYHLLPPVLLLPLLLTGVVFAIAGVRWLTRSHHRVAGGLLLSDDGSLARIELVPVHPKWGIAIGAVIMGAFVLATLVYGFQLRPPIWAVASGAGLIVTASLATYLWMCARRARGDGALLVDRGRRELRLPQDLADFHGKATIRFDDIEAIESFDVRTLGEEATQGTHVVKVRPHGCNHIRSLPIRRTSNPTEAEDLAQWLRRQVLGQNAG